MIIKSKLRATVAQNEVKESSKVSPKKIEVTEPKYKVVEEKPVIIEEEPIIVEEDLTLFDSIEEN